jgi:uncharacterized membrane protein YfcA
MVRLFILFAAGLAGGALNSVAGGGSFITLPTLLYAGVAPVASNATSTLALWPGTVSSAVAYRRDIRTPRSILLPLGAASLAGGVIGARLLLRTSDTNFLRLLPWLMATAATMFTVGGRLGARGGDRPDGRLAWWSVPIQGIIAVYGGYFGGGMGIMMLGVFSFAGLRDIHGMNGLKTLLGSTVNGIALVAFIASGTIVWHPGLVMIAGAVVGGYGGARLARRVDRRLVRAVVIAVGWGMAAYFFFR